MYTEAKQKYRKEYYQRNKEKILKQTNLYRETHRVQVSRKQRDTILRRVYNISLEEWEIKMEIQDYKCAICTKDLRTEKPQTDHCHESENVRGILCAKCNWGLGMFNDNPELMYKAAEYIKQHS